MPHCTTSSFFALMFGSSMFVYGSMSDSSQELTVAAWYSDHATSERGSGVSGPTSMDSSEWL